MTFLQVSAFGAVAVASSALVAASGTLAIANGTTNLFFENPPADAGGLAPSLFLNGNVSIGGTSPETATYTEWLSRPTNGCTVSGTVFYALELTTPNPFGFVATTSGRGFMDLILTTSGTAHAELFDEATCNVLGGPSAMVAGGGGTLEFSGGDTQTVFGGHTIVVEAYR